MQPATRTCTKSGCGVAVMNQMFFTRNESVRSLPRLAIATSVWPYHLCSFRTLILIEYEQNDVRCCESESIKLEDIITSLRCLVECLLFRLHPMFVNTCCCLALFASGDMALSTSSVGSFSSKHVAYDSRKRPCLSRPSYWRGRHGFLSTLRSPRDSRTADKWSVHS